jgi:hypothetical protein
VIERVIAAPSTDLPCPHCHVTMRLVRRLDLKGMPEIYVLYCSRCQHGETVTQERAWRRSSSTALVRSCSSIVTPRRLIDYPQPGAGTLTQLHGRLIGTGIRRVESYRRSNSGSLAMLLAIRRADSRTASIEDYSHSHRACPR